MKKIKLHLKQISVVLFLSSVLLNTSNTYAITSAEISSENFSSELPKPQFQNQMGSFSVDFTMLNVNAETITSNLNDYFGLNDKNSFRLENEQTFDQGIIYLKFQHYYDDIKIEGDVVFIQVKNSKLQYVSGQLININEFNISSTISDVQIKDAAYEFFGNKENVTEGAIETLLFKHQNGESVEIKLVKKISLFGSAPVKAEDVFIDAHSGKVIFSDKKIYHVDTPSTSATYYRGNQSITVDSYGGSYRLKDNARNIHTRNGAGWDGGGNTVTGDFTGNITDYVNSTANFIGNATKPAVEVHWGMSKTYDYYKNIHNRRSYDNKGSIIRNYYNPPTSLFEAGNAAALDHQGIVGMMYGSGGQYNNPMVALDVAGHEFSHLVISRTANLRYLNESGALNESFADMFGTAIEFYTNLSPNWTIGEGLWKTSVPITPNYLRSMSNPNSGPAAIQAQQPDTYKGTYWHDYVSQPNIDNGGVHINSGVSNYWFYLLSVGGSGTNDISDVYNVSGIGIQKAEQIAYRALTTGLSSTATFMDARNATLQAAATLFGYKNEWTQVLNAWFAVGIGGKTASTQNPEMESKLNVYPNPTTGDEVTIDSSLEDATTVEMFDLTGKRVLAPRNLDYRTTINVSGFKTGMYILKFKSNLGEYSHKLMIK